VEVESKDLDVFDVWKSGTVKVDSGADENVSAMLSVQQHPDSLHSTSMSR